ncbi:hypothetical protein RJT17_36740 [Streptomyces sp. P5-A9]|uniref:hypothetical protein n=1 Tax=Streptomyces sp. P5-A9 TaxID=3071730 RepID=UPI002FCB88CF
MTKIRELGLRQSCGRTGSRSDNAAAESFWALPKEEIGTRIRPDRTTTRPEVFTYIEAFHNRRRLLSADGDGGRGSVSAPSLLAAPRTPPVTPVCALWQD